MRGITSNDKSHEILSDMAKHDVEQPGDTPSDSMPNQETHDGEKTEAAPRDSD